MILQLEFCDYVCLIVLHRHELEKRNIINVKFCHAKAKGRRCKLFQQTILFLFILYYNHDMVYEKDDKCHLFE
jgi:hypothetical protein